jgi:hypothetical protein
MSDNKQKKTGTSNKKTPESYTPKKKNTEGKVWYRPWLYKLCRKQACISMLMSILDFGIYMSMFMIAPYESLCVRDIAMAFNFESRAHDNFLEEHAPAPHPCFRWHCCIPFTITFAKGSMPQPHGFPPTHVKISQLVNKMCSQQACSKLVNKL